MRADRSAASGRLAGEANSSADSFVVKYSVTGSGMTLTPKMQRQPTPSRNTPPSSGPITNAVPVHAVQVQLAGACSVRDNGALILANELGTRNAAPAPC